MDNIEQQEDLQPGFRPLQWVVMAVVTPVARFMCNNPQAREVIWRKIHMAVGTPAAGEHIATLQQLLGSEAQATVQSSDLIAWAMESGLKPASPVIIDVVVGGERVEVGTDELFFSADDEEHASLTFVNDTGQAYQLELERL